MPDEMISVISNAIIASKLRKHSEGSIKMVESIAEKIDDKYGGLWNIFIFESGTSMGFDVWTTGERDIKAIYCGIQFCIFK